VRRVGDQHFRHAGDLRGGFGGGGAVRTGDEHVHLIARPSAALGGRGHGVVGCALQGAIVVFSDY
jgi:hypothetical protein